MAGDAGEQGLGAVGGEAERAEERAGGRVPAVGRHHEQPVAAHGRLQVERRRAERQLQLHAHAGPRRRGGGAALWGRRHGRFLGAG